MQLNYTVNGKLPRFETSSSAHNHHFKPIVIAYKVRASIDRDLLDLALDHKVHWISAAEVQNLDRSEAKKLHTTLAESKQFLAVHFKTSHFDDWRVYEYPTRLAQWLHADIVACHIEGSDQHPTRFADNQAPINKQVKFSLTFSSPHAVEIHSDDTTATYQTVNWVADNEFFARLPKQSLLQALYDARCKYGKKRVVLNDVRKTPVDYQTLFKGSFALGHAIKGFTDKGEHVGLLLPTSVGATLAFFALQAYERIPALLNFSAGINAIEGAVETAEIKHVLSSKAFIQKAELQDAVEALERKVKVIYLEDLRKNLRFKDKLMGAIGMIAPQWLIPKVNTEDKAAVLFTSGSEGHPKGVILSHRNFLANRLQILTNIKVHHHDRVFNALPMFHCFGLTVGLLTPLYEGAITYLYPSPLHFKTILELVKEQQPTIFFSTDTFLKGYARIAKDDENPFESIRLLVSGAEKVRDDTRRHWKKRFGVDILEGYGVTECTPVIAANTAMASKPNSVGRALPGIETKLEPVDGIPDGGKLLTKGPNVMTGYLRVDNPGVVDPPKDGWHDTGDIVTIDEHGYITIQGRAKRFAKIGGEMVSLTMVEDLALNTWPDICHAAVSVQDNRKGERIVLVTQKSDADRKAIMAQAKASGISDLAVPKTIHYIEELPVLSSGKTDYVRLQKVIEAELDM